MRDEPVYLVDSLTAAATVVVAGTVILTAAAIWWTVALTAQAVQAVRRKL